MPKSRLFAFLILFAFALVAGCGGSSGVSNFGGGNPPPAGSSQASLSITDAPPAGVSVLSFEVNIISATLSPGNIPLLNTPTEIEIKHLETEKAFLGSLSIPANTYTGLNVTLAGTELTILNGTTSAINAFGQTCNPNAVCKFKPNAPPITVSYAGAPFPLIVAANTPVGLVVDVNLNNIISNTLGIDFTVPNGVIVTQATAPPTGELGKLDDLKGMVVSTDSTNNQFVLHTMAGDRTIKVDTSTVYKDFDEGNPPCPNPQNFSCVKQGQMLEVDISLLGSGMLLAKKVELESHNANEEGLEGIITSVDAANSKFNIVAVENFSALLNAVGSPMTVSVQLGATFDVQPGDVTVDPALVSGFTGGKMAALLAGQSVRVHRLSGDGSTATPILTDRVRLEASRFTATVAAGSRSGNNFNVNGLPSLFASQLPPIATIAVQTVPGQTEFEGFTPATIAGVGDGNLVSIRGLLFKTAVNPTMVASKVRKRS